MMRFTLSALLLGTLGFTLVAQQERGNRAYRNDSHVEAVQRYREALRRDENTPVLRYNLGTALLAMGDDERATGELERSLVHAKDAELRARAFYNLGNAYASGDDGQLRKAVESYRRALLLQPDHEDAKWNLELVRRRLEERDSPTADREAPNQPPQQQDRDDQRGTGGPSPQRPDGPTGDAPQNTGTESAPTSSDDALGPLPVDLAEQILRAVEEQERGVQRRSLRDGSPTDAAGPDW